MNAPRAGTPGAFVQDVQESLLKKDAANREMQVKNPGKKEYDRPTL
jgi:hypothetical protein